MNFRITNCNDVVHFKGNLRDCLAVALNQRKESTGFHHIDIKHDGRPTKEDVSRDESGVEWRYFVFVSTNEIETYGVSLQAMRVIEKFANAQRIAVRKTYEQ